MSPRLKPLFLPQLVERRKQQQDELVEQNFVYLADNTSSSDLASPVTPTFSQRGGHARYSSSTSSLDLSQPANPCTAEAAASPAQPPVQPSAAAPVSPASVSASSTPAPSITSKAPKRSLPDVQEEPLERDDCDDTVLPLYESLDSDSYCLCNEPCDHGRPSLIHSATAPLPDVDYDAGFLSDNEFGASLCPTKKRRGRSGLDSPLSGLSSRLSSRLPSLSRWRSAERRAATSALSFTTSETTLDHRPSLSIAPSSRSSSVSGRGRRLTLDRTNEPPLPPTPALSFYESSDSISLPTPLDIEAANAMGQSLERERAMATTPLLPPVMTNAPSSVNLSAPQSPLEFPKMEPHQLVGGGSELNSPQYFPSPALSTKASVSSFRHAAAGSSLSTPATVCTPEIPSPMFSLDLHDSWSDRLGHANFTVLPKPYVPDEVDLLVLQALRSDWDQARMNFTKHLMRTGEHYGTTSKTYSLTEAKWAEIEHEWRAAHDSVVDRFAAICNGNGDASEALRWRRQQDDVSPSTVTRMIDVKTKFPDLGDEDIVGPMVRDAAVARDLSPARESSASRLWRTITGRASLKK